MTDGMMSLHGHLEKSADADMSRETIGFAAERLMGIEGGRPSARVGSAWAARHQFDDTARQQWRRVADQFRPKMPKLAALMDGAEGDVLADLTFPPAHRTRLHSTHPPKRVSGDIKRRTDVVGGSPTWPRAGASSVLSCSNGTTTGWSSARAP